MKFCIAIALCALLVGTVAANLGDIRTCEPGYYKNYTNEDDNNAWNCAPCRKNAISSIEKSYCIDCPVGHVPNSMKTDCIVRDVEFWTIETHSITVATIFSIMGLFTMLIMFYKLLTRGAIVILRQPELSFITFLGIVLAYICMSLLLMVQASTISCVLMAVMPHLCYTILFTSILSRTRAEYERRNFHKLKYQCSRSTLLTITTFLIIIQIFICGILLIIDPQSVTIQEYPSQTSPYICHIPAIILFVPFAYNSLVLGVWTLCVFQLITRGQQYVRDCLRASFAVLVCLIWIWAGYNYSLDDVIDKMANERLTLSYIIVFVLVVFAPHTNFSLGDNGEIIYDIAEKDINAIVELATYVKSTYTPTVTQ